METERVGEIAIMKSVRRILIAVVGCTVLALGLALIVLPGPAFLVIPAGLAILGLEFAWARRWLHKVRGLVGSAFRRKERSPAS